MSQVTNGIGDFRTSTFDKGVSLDGSYEFYWQQLLAPGDFHEKTKSYVDFPSLWNDQIAGDEDLAAIGFATYRAKLLLPEGAYTLHIEDVYTAYRLYWNGKEIAKNGEVASTREEYVPYWKPMFVPLTDIRDTNELVLQIANFDHSKGGALEGIEIGHQQYMSDKELAMTAYDLLLTGSLLMGGLFFLGLYFFGRHDRAILFFSIFCIVYSYRIIGFGYYVLHSLLEVSWHLTTRLEYATLFLSALIFGWFVHYLYPREAKKIIWQVISVISIVFIVVTFLTPASVYTHLIEPFFVILLIYLLITFVVYVRARLHRRPGSGFALLSTAVVFLVFGYNILVYFRVLESWMAATFWGYMLFFFSQSLILSFRFAYFLKDAKNEALKASQAKTDFLSTISHEIRTPLNAVVGISHFLLQDNPGAHQQKNLVSLRYSAEHLTALINDILDYNKLESGRVTFEQLNVNMKDTVQSIHHAYAAKAQKNGLELRLDYDAGITTAVVADKTRFSQVLNNLLDNAIKFTREGHIVLKVSKVEESSGKITLKVAVADTGIGVPKDKQTIIFDRFMQASTSTTREFGGTGLGLAIIKKLLELQGSQIRLDSEEGKGSTFWFEQTFEKAIGAVHEEEKVEDFSDEHLLEGRKVLLVEDNPTNVMVAEKFLKHWKMVMDVAENGQVAVQLAADGYDIILMDLQMPVMDGYQAARSIRAAQNPVPIVALTASALIRVQEEVLSAGMNDYITKPFDPAELKRKLIKNMRQ